MTQPSDPCRGWIRPHQLRRCALAPSLSFVTGDGCPAEHDTRPSSQGDRPSNGNHACLRQVPLQEEVITS
jgi:hypothetical protein